MKRGNIRSTRVYSKEGTKYAVQVRLRNKQHWVQAKAGEEVLIFDTQEEADRIVSDYSENLKKTLSEKLTEGKVKLNAGRKKK